MSIDGVNPVDKVTFYRMLEDLYSQPDNTKKLEKIESYIKNMNIRNFENVKELTQVFTRIKRDFTLRRMPVDIRILRLISERLQLSMPHLSHTVKTILEAETHANIVKKELGLVSVNATQQEEEKLKKIDTQIKEWAAATGIDKVEAGRLLFSIYREAASRGSRSDTCYLYAQAICYYRGIGVGKDDETALSLLISISETYSTDLNDKARDLIKEILT